MAKELGTKVYDRYVTRRKLCSGQLEKLRVVYEGYIQLLAKDSQVGVPGTGEDLWAAAAERRWDKAVCPPHHKHKVWVLQTCCCRSHQNQ